LTSVFVSNRIEIGKWALPYLEYSHRENEKSSQMVFQGEACCFHIEEHFFRRCWPSKVAVMTAVDVTDPLQQENKKELCKLRFG
jgi:hypothetical protein